MEATTLVLERIHLHPAVQRVILYGSRALGRHRSGSDIDLCLQAPALGLGELLQLGAELDDLLLPWRIDLQLLHLIDHPTLLEHIARAGMVLWEPPGAA
ncbi:nucleotidyltransferase domain-containing protein [Cyanobium sp. ATX 6F1]|uniref:nucleotidyltransferase domain-containing protein n=1 Tax=unclassified Cyanobium TaxID=2627006 RepID=UPI0020CD11A8|nr:nucleotidyltransferase domain-containing protein [Cyanobium sp. ATX 6F1]